MMDERKIRPLRWWCHKIIPLIYDDSLSYYEVLCKLTAVLNQVIETVNGFIDEDIEGYIKALVDEYATEEIHKLLEEITIEDLTPIIRQIAEEEVTAFLNGYKDAMDRMDKKLATFTQQFNITPIREFYIEAETYDFVTPSENVLNAKKCDGFTMSPTHYYVTSHGTRAGATFFIIRKYSRSDYSLIESHEVTGYGNGGHICYYDGRIYGVDNVNHRIYSMDTNYSDFKTYSFTPTANFDIGRICIDGVTGKVYTMGTMTAQNNFNIYETTLNDSANTATFETLSEQTEVQLSIIQNICAYDGMLYISGSNPNCIICFDTGAKVFANSYRLADRFDDILPIGELQGLAYEDDKLYMIGYNLLCVSGKRYLWSVGYLDFATGVLTQKNTDIAREFKIIYVNHTFAQNAVESSQHHYKYNKYKATGWQGAYDYLPFASLWEAIECAVGAFAKIGKQSIIRVADTYLYDACEVPSYAINQISGFDPLTDEAVYWRVRGLEVKGGSSTELLRCGFTGLRSTDTGYADGFSMLFVDGAICRLNDCYFLYASGSVIGSTTWNGICRVDDGSSLFCGGLSDSNNWNVPGIAYTDLAGHIPEGRYFMFVSTGIVNYKLFGDDYLDAENYPLHTTRGAYVNLT